MKAVILDDFAEADNLMREIGSQGYIDKDAYQTKRVAILLMLLRIRLTT